MTYDRAHAHELRCVLLFSHAVGAVERTTADLQSGSGPCDGKFIHNPRANPPDGLSGPVIGKPKSEWQATSGGFYAPYVVERFTKVVGPELHLYYCLSTWNPYVVVLMKSRFAVE